MNSILNKSLKSQDQTYSINIKRRSTITDHYVYVALFPVYLPAELGVSRLKVSQQISKYVYSASTTPADLEHY